jgi:hypothetical protein
MPPIITTFAGGSARGFISSGQSIQNLITAASGGYTKTTAANGVEMYHSNHATNSNSYNAQAFSITLDPGTFYVAMIGASGARQNSSYNASLGTQGAGGLSVFELTVTSAQTVWGISGSGGILNTTSAQGASAIQYGGRGGGSNQPVWTPYYKGSGGGGLTYLSTGNGISTGWVIAMVGSGGGIGATTNNTAGATNWHSHGGGLDQSGIDGAWLNASYPNSQGRGGTPSAGGQRGTDVIYSVTSTATDGQQLQGGNGSLGAYDGGSGGGAGWYGGGGSTGGGGYNAASGGGGSGKNNASAHSGISITVDGNYNSNGYNAGNFQSWIRTLSGNTTFTVGNYGQDIGTASSDGNAGYICIWTKN